ncbi:MAG: hypothetical protein HKO86_01510 [Gammaproteobacteria bacterium]|nr:hypothetical protein [Gammaproteobacteria bacterium]
MPLINYWLFKSKTLSAMLYPYFRNLLLKILAKTRVNNPGMKANAKL